MNFVNLDGKKCGCSYNRDFLSLLVEPLTISKWDGQHNIFNEKSYVDQECRHSNYDSRMQLQVDGKKKSKSGKSEGKITNII